MKKIIFLLFIITFTSCNSNDPFNTIEFGKADYDKTIHKLLKDGIISEPSKDSSSFRSYINIDNSITPVEVYFNPDLYKYGSVRQIEINLNGDSTYDIFDDNKLIYSRGGGPRSYLEIENIYNKYVRWYGKPDSLLTYPIKKTNSNNYFFQPKTPDSSAILGKRAYWRTSSFDLEFDIPTSFVDEKRDSMNFVKYSSIKYSMLEYEYRLQNLRDSIRKTLKPEDLISMKIYNPEWNENPYGYNNTLSIEVGHVKRIDREEDRGVVAIKFDVIFRDIFKKELARVEDVVFEPYSPLMNGSRDGFVRSSALSTRYTSQYNSSTKQGREVSSLKRYKESNKIFIDYEMKSIVFDDGSILNKK